MQRHHIVRMEASIRNRTGMTRRFFCFADVSPEPDEVEVKGQEFLLWDERRHPLVSFYCIHPVWDETKSLPDTKDVSVNGKSVSSQAKQEETVNGLGTDPLQAAQRFINFLVAHPS